MPRWLIPVAYFFASLAASLLIPRFEFALLPASGDEISVSTAQALLGAVSSGMMAFTAIVFSIGFLFIQYTATAYSKRFMILFAQKSLVFHAFGLFVSTFTFALGTLAFVNRHGTQWVPYTSILIVGALLVLSIAVMAVLMFQVAALRITRVLASLADVGRGMMSRMDDVESDGREIPPALGEPTSVTYSGSSRVVAAIDKKELVTLARQANATIRLECAVGDTLYRGGVVARVYGAQAHVGDGAIVGALRLARENTFDGDIRFPIRLLVDTAIMALSPAVNDPTTAVEALDEILDLMLRLGARNLESGVLADESGAVRLIYPAPTWNDYLSLAFDEIRRYGAESFQVVRRLRAALVRLADALQNEDRRKAVIEYRNRLDAAVARLGLDAVDMMTALGIDPQGLGLTRLSR